MVRLSANSIRVVGDAEEEGIDATPAENVNEPDHVGAWLREAREATGRDLRDVAAHLRIRYPYLLAIEEGRFDDLPGRAYIVGFIRSYAGHLGLDAEAMVARYKADADAVIAEQNLKFPTPAPEGRFPGSGALIASAILVAAAIGGWYYYQNRDAVDLDRVPEPPQSAAIADPATGTPPPATAAPASSETPENGATTMADAESDMPQAGANEASADTAPTVSAATEPAMPEVAVTMTATAERDARETMAAAGTAEPALPGATAPVVEQMAAPEPTEPALPATIETPAAETPVAEMPAVGTPNAATPAVETPVAATPAPLPEPQTAEVPSPPPAAVAAAPEPAIPDAEPSVPASPGAALPDAAEAVAAAPAGDAAGTAEPTAPEPTAPEPVASEPAASEPAVADAPQAAALPSPPQVATTEDQQGRVYGLTNRDARVVLTARGESWVQVRDSAQTVLFTRTLQAGESYRVPNRQGLLMRVGNPRMLDISIDGSVPVQLSDSDRPIQDVTLDPQVLRDAVIVR